MILNTPWPPNLDPVDVPFRTRTVTVLARMGFFGDPSLFNTLTDAEVLSWTNAGPKTVTDIRTTGNAAIRRHHEQVSQLPPLQADLAVVAGELWARHIWHRDPRFAEYLPRVDATVYDNRRHPGRPTSPVGQPRRSQGSRRRPSCTHRR